MVGIVALLSITGLLLILGTTNYFKASRAPELSAAQSVEATFEPKATSNTGSLPGPETKAMSPAPYLDFSEDNRGGVPVASPGPEQVAKGPARLEALRIKRGSTVFDTLISVGVSPRSIQAIIDAAQPHKNLANVAARTLVHVIWHQNPDADNPDQITFKLSDTEKLVVEQTQTVTESVIPPTKAEIKWTARIDQAEVTSVLASFSGTVNSSLWYSASLSGMDPFVIQKMAEVFAWQIDFSRQVRVGDRWRLVVEQFFVDERPIGWGDIVVATYENGGVPVTAIRFDHDEMKRSYFEPDGQSLERLFLKSPLRFGRVTSKFNKARFHPILKRRRPHNGVDYGAPTGTPVMAVGDGVVTMATRRGGSGKMVKLRHNATYQTAYKHLSRYGKNIRKGRKVEMGQVIGYVGATGLATGPHLHFEFWEHGKFVDPQGVKFPSADPVPEKLMASFNEVAKVALAKLPPWPQMEPLVNKKIAQAVREGREEISER